MKKEIEMEDIDLGATGVEPVVPVEKKVRKPRVKKVVDNSAELITMAEEKINTLPTSQTDRVFDHDWNGLVVDVQLEDDTSVVQMANTLSEAYDIPEFNDHGVSYGREPAKVGIDGVTGRRRNELEERRKKKEKRVKKAKKLTKRRNTRG